MVKKIIVVWTACWLLCSSGFAGTALAHDADYTFPFEKIKKFLLKETGYVASPDHINGYHDEGNGKVSVYCTRVAAGNAIVAQILYQFLLLQTDSGPRWLYLGSVKSQFID